MPNAADLSAEDKSHLLQLPVELLVSILEAYFTSITLRVNQSAGDRDQRHKLHILSTCKTIRNTALPAYLQCLSKALNEAQLDISQRKRNSPFGMSSMNDQLPRASWLLKNISLKKESAKFEGAAEKVRKEIGALS